MPDEVKKRYDLIDYGLLGRIIEYYEKTNSCITFPHKWSFNESDNPIMGLQRLGRALSNVCGDDAGATYSRYAIWGADLNKLTEDAIDALKNSDTEQAINYVQMIQRNARAFVDCCLLIDTQPGHMCFKDPVKILNSIKEKMEETGEHIDRETCHLYKEICQQIEEQKLRTDMIYLERR